VDENVNMFDENGIGQLLRRGATTYATNQKVKASVIDMNNQW